MVNELNRFIYEEVFRALEASTHIHSIYSTCIGHRNCTANTQNAAFSISSQTQLETMTRTRSSIYLHLKSFSYIFLFFSHWLLQHFPMSLIKVSRFWKEVWGMMSTYFLRQSGLGLVKSDYSQTPWTAEDPVLLLNFLDKLSGRITVLTLPKCLLIIQEHCRSLKYVSNK